MERNQLKRNFLNLSNFFGGLTFGQKMMTHRKCWEEENKVFPKEEPQWGIQYQMDKFAWDQAHTGNIRRTENVVFVYLGNNTLY